MIYRLRKKAFCGLVWVLCALTGMRANATHIFGGELLYKHISGNTYVLELTLYGDCSASIFNTLYTATPTVFVSSSAMSNTQRTLYPVAGTGTEVSAVCPAMRDQTVCNNGTLPGVKQFIYTDTLNLPPAPDWTFTFTSMMGSSSAGRSSNITNVQQPGTSGVYLVATLNNETGHNSSPVYSTIPTPYYCLNILQQYNQGAVDSDNDSLSFALVSAINNNGIDVGYVSPYTPQAPLAASDFTFSTINGQMKFLPDELQNSLVVNQVTEYRDGKVVGTSMREMTFIVLNNCNNNPPTGDLVPVTVTGGTYAGDNVINVCKTSPDISFLIAGGDKDADNIKVTINNLPAGATLDILGDSTNNPDLAFRWNVANVSPGIYTFYVNYEDDHCAISSSQTIAYTINVVKPNSFTMDIIKPTECLHQAYVRYALSHGTLPRTVTVTDGASITRTYVDNTGIVTDSLPVGNYSVSVSSAYLDCGSQSSFSITDDGTLPTPAKVVNEYCQFDELKPLTIIVHQDATVQWQDEQGTPLAGMPAFSTQQAGLYTWYVSQQFKVCASMTDTFQLLVRALPDMQLDAIPKVVCLGDTVHLPIIKDLSYVWSPMADLETDAGGRLYTRRLMQPTTYTVQGTDVYGCVNTASVKFDQIERCCRFSYPDAFTPNGDGRNDQYHVVTYGNMESFDLRIYNRWGQCVYSSNIQDAGWDGTFKGVPCDMGTYYFQLHSKCMTGKTEFHEGPITLIR